MKNVKSKKGITLVALIITIIVLLILTVVAISSITDQGLFTKSQESVNSYEDSRKAEEGKLTGYASEIDRYLQKEKDRVYILPEGNFYFKIAKDRIYISEGADFKFSYVTVTPAILKIVKGYGGTIPDNVSDYSCALELEIEDEEENLYLLLSKDEEILYYGPYELILESEIKSYGGKINGDEVIAVLFPNNKVTVTIDGTAVANKITPEKVTTPEGISNSENYSQFYKVVVDGMDVTYGISKDGKTLTLVGMGDLTLIGSSEWKTYGTPSNYFLVGKNKVYIVANGVLDNTTFDVEYTTFEEYYKGTMLSDYTIDERLKSVHNVWTGEWTDDGLSRRIYAAISDDGYSVYIIRHNSAEKALDIPLKYTLNNSIYYSSVLEQIQ